MGQDLTEPALGAWNWDQDSFDLRLSKVKSKALPIPFERDRHLRLVFLQVCSPQHQPHLKRGRNADPRALSIPTKSDLLGVGPNSLCFFQALLVIVMHTTIRGPLAYSKQNDSIISLNLVVCHVPTCRTVCATQEAMLKRMDKNHQETPRTG